MTDETARRSRLNRDERAFQAAAIEIMETPASPSARWLIAFIVASAAGGAGLVLVRPPRYACRAARPHHPGRQGPGGRAADGRDDPGHPRSARRHGCGGRPAGRARPGRARGRTDQARRRPCRCRDIGCPAEGDARRRRARRAGGWRQLPAAAERRGRHGAASNGSRCASRWVRSGPSRHASTRRSSSDAPNAPVSPQRWKNGAACLRFPPSG